MQILTKKVRAGVLAANRKPVKKDTVAGYPHAVAQIHAGMRAPDPRLDKVGKIDFCLARQLAAYRKADPSPT
eukprot:8273818-Ditylum_brightwellii.AAC.1